MTKRPTDADLAIKLCHAIRSATAHRARRARGCVQWVSLVEVRRDLDVSHEALLRAVSYGVTEGWLNIDPGQPPHSVCLVAGYWSELAAAA